VFGWLWPSATIRRRCSARLAARGAVARAERFKGRTLFFPACPLCAAGYARSHHRVVVAAVVVCGAERRSAASGPLTIAHTTLTMCFVAVVVQSRARFARSQPGRKAAMDLGCDSGAGRWFVAVDAAR